MWSVSGSSPLVSNDFDEVVSEDHTLPLITDPPYSDGSGVAVCYAASAPSSRGGISQIPEPALGTASRFTMLSRQSDVLRLEKQHDVFAGHDRVAVDTGRVRTCR